MQESRGLLLTESTSQIRIVVSSDAEARYTLSADHAMSDRPFVCPFRFRMSSPVNGDQIFTTLSFAAKASAEANCYKRAWNAPQDARSVPSGLNFTADIDEVCPRIVCRSS